MPFLAPIAVPLFIGFTVVSTYMQYKSAKQQAQDEATIREYNAQVAEQEATATRRSALEEQRVRREEANRRIETIRAKQADAGILPDLVVLTEAAMTMSEDIAVLAYEREIDALRHEKRAAAERFYGEFALRAGKLRSQQALFSGLGRIASFGATHGAISGGKIA